MRYFCTYFDLNYLTRGLALYSSLEQHCSCFELWVLCMDSATHAALKQLAMPRVHLIPLEEFEAGDDELLEAKQNRSRIEYYFTCTPSLPLFILRKYEQVDLITYLDADLFFFSDIEPVFQEIGENSIAIIPHRFPPSIQHCSIFGTFNVGWLSFRRDKTGVACLLCWRHNCNEWCYDRLEGARFADQKYLDNWPQRFEHLHVIRHKGANVAPWNIGNYDVRKADNKVLVDEQLLIFFHFHGLKHISAGFFDPGFVKYQTVLSWAIRLNIYRPYIKLLLEMDRMIGGAFAIAAENHKSLRTYQVRPRSLAGSLLRFQRMVSMRNFIFVFKGFVI